MTVATLPQPTTQYRLISWPLFVVSIGLAAHIALLWRWDYLPLIDWPNHMARHFLESLWLAGRPLPEGYAIHYALVPNLGADLVVPLLLQFLSPVTASASFLTFAVLVCWFGFSGFIRRQANHPIAGTGAALLVLPWLLTNTFFWGFLNYYSSLGIAFLVFCNWQRITEKKTTKPSQLAIHTAFIVLLYIWHLAGLVTYLILHASFEAYALYSRRTSAHRLYGDVLVFVPLAALVIMEKLTRGPGAISGHAIWWPFAKFASTAGLFLGYYPSVDLVVMALWLSAILTMFRIKCIKLQLTSWLQVAAAAFLVAYLVLPYELGSTSGVDFRMLPPLLVCILALAARLPVRNVALGSILILLATLLRLGSIGVAWADLADQSHQYIQAIRRMPEGSRILVVITERYSRLKPFHHSVALGGFRARRFCLLAFF